MIFSRRGFIFSVGACTLMISTPSLSSASARCENLFGRGKTELVQAPATRSFDANPDLKTATKNLTAYRNSISSKILEREFVIEPFLVSLIAKEHMLLIGPPGNAKTTLAKMLLSNIVDAKTGAASFYSMQMNKEITLSDTHGSINFKALSNEGVVRRNYGEGLLGAKTGFIDEAFDIRPGAFRNILDVLAERAHSQGTTHHKGQTEIIIAATNKTLSEVYEEFNNSEQPRALIDRFAFVLFVPKEMESRLSDRMIFKGTRADNTPVHQLTYQDLSVIRDISAKVEVPSHLADLAAIIHYRLTPEFESREVKATELYREKIQSGEHALPPFRAAKYLSPRTLAKAGSILRAIVALDYAQSGGKRGLTATIEDLSKLRAFYQLGGPSDKMLSEQLGRALKEYEKDQIKAVQTERSVVNPIFDLLIKEFNDAVAKLNLHDLDQSIRDYSMLSVPAKRKVAENLKLFYQQTLHTMDIDLKDDVTAETIAINATQSIVKSYVMTLWSKQAPALLAAWQKQSGIDESKLSEKLKTKIRRKQLGYRDPQSKGGFKALSQFESEVARKKKAEVESVARAKREAEEAAALAKAKEESAAAEKARLEAAAIWENNERTRLEAVRKAEELEKAHLEATKQAEELAKARAEALKQIEAAEAAQRAVGGPPARQTSTDLQASPGKVLKGISNPRVTSTDFTGQHIFQQNVSDTKIAAADGTGIGSPDWGVTKWILPHREFTIGATSNFRSDLWRLQANGGGPAIPVEGGILSASVADDHFMVFTDNSIGYIDAANLKFHKVDVMPAGFIAGAAIPGAGEGAYITFHSDQRIHRRLTKTGLKETFMGPALNLSGNETLQMIGDSSGFFYNDRTILAFQFSNENGTKATFNNQPLFVVSYDGRKVAHLDGKTVKIFDAAEYHERLINERTAEAPRPALVELTTQLDAPTKLIFSGDSKKLIVVADQRLEVFELDVSPPPPASTTSASTRSSAEVWSPLNRTGVTSPAKYLPSRGARILALSGDGSVGLSQDSVTGSRAQVSVGQVMFGKDIQNQHVFGARGSWALLRDAAPLKNRVLSIFSDYRELQAVKGVGADQLNFTTQPKVLSSNGSSAIVFTENTADWITLEDDKLVNTKQTPLREGFLTGGAIPGHDGEFISFHKSPDGTTELYHSASSQVIKVAADSSTMQLIGEGPRVRMVTDSKGILLSEDKKRFVVFSIYLPASGYAIKARFAGLQNPAEVSADGRIIAFTTADGVRLFPAEEYIDKWAEHSSFPNEFDIPTAFRDTKRIAMSSDGSKILIANEEKYQILEIGSKQ